LEFLPLIRMMAELFLRAARLIYHAFQRKVDSFKQRDVLGLIGQLGSGLHQVCNSATCSIALY